MVALLVVVEVEDCEPEIVGGLEVGVCHCFQVAFKGSVEGGEPRVKENWRGVKRVDVSFILRVGQGTLTHTKVRRRAMPKIVS